MSATPAQTTEHLMACWTEPLIADCVFIGYEKILGRNRFSEGISSVHCQMWKGLLEQDMVSATTAVLKLVDMAQSLRFNWAIVQSIDAKILARLSEVILLRGRSSRSTARREGRNLIAAARAIREFGCVTSSVGTTSPPSVSADFNVVRIRRTDLGQAIRFSSRNCSVGKEGPVQPASLRSAPFNMPYLQR